MPIEIIPALKKDLPQIQNLVKTTFDKYVGHEFTEEGRKEFYKYLRLENFRTRIVNNHFLLVALDKKKLVGLIEIRNYQDVSLFFVNDAYHGQGIGKKLFANALKVIKDNNKTDKINVKASRFAVPIYRRFGFSVIGKETTSKGIIYIPMEMNIKH